MIYCLWDVWNKPKNSLNCSNYEIKNVLNPTKTWQWYFILIMIMTVKTVSNITNIIWFYKIFLWTTSRVNVLNLKCSFCRSLCWCKQDQLLAGSWNECVRPGLWDDEQWLLQLPHQGCGGGRNPQDGKGTRRRKGYVFGNILSLLGSFSLLYFLFSVFSLFINAIIVLWVYFINACSVLDKCNLIFVPNQIAFFIRDVEMPSKLMLWNNSTIDKIRYFFCSF